jgi:hypothetical protein
MPAPDPSSPRATTKEIDSELADDSSSSAVRPSLALVLFLSSFLALYFELVIIRYLSTEIRVFAYFKNLSLISCFLGLGLGMALGSPPKALKRLFPLVAAVLFLLVALAARLHLTIIPAPGEDYFLFGQNNAVITHLMGALRYALIVLFLIALVVAFCMVLGGMVGESLAGLPPLRGYGINLAGSLAGIAAFKLLSYWDSPPGVWILLGFLVGLPFVYREARAVLIFAFVIIVVVAAQGGGLLVPLLQNHAGSVSSSSGLASPPRIPVDRQPRRSPNNLRPLS